MPGVNIEKETTFLRQFSQNIVEQSLPTSSINNSFLNIEALKIRLAYFSRKYSSTDSQAFLLGKGSQKFLTDFASRRLLPKKSVKDGPI